MKEKKRGREKKGGREKWGGSAARSVIAVSKRNTAKQI